MFYIRLMRMMTIVPTKALLNIFLVQTESVDDYLSISRRAKSTATFVFDEATDFVFTIGLYLKDGLRAVSPQGIQDLKHALRTKTDTELWWSFVHLMTGVFVLFSLSIIFAFEVAYPLLNFLYTGWTDAGEAMEMLWVGSMM